MTKALRDFVPEYCASMLEELSQMAKNAGEPMLSSLIALAAVEARTVARRRGAADVTGGETAARPSLAA